MDSSRLPIGVLAPDFQLPGVDGQTYSLNNFSEKKVLAVLFTCNHCPYVQAYEDRLITIQADFMEKGVALLAINANETKNYPEDNLDNMILRAKEQGYNFPYLRDDDQAVANAYGAHYTPEVFLFDQGRRLRYTGRIDDNWKEASKARTHDFRKAIEALLSNQAIKNEETHAVGCTIKWAQI